MKILPNIKYDGMKFQHVGFIFMLKFINNEWNVFSANDILLVRTDISSIKANFKSGRWEQIK